MSLTVEVVEWILVNVVEIDVDDRVPSIREETFLTESVHHVNEGVAIAEEEIHLSKSRRHFAVNGTHMEDQTKWPNITLRAIQIYCALFSHNNHG